MLPPYHSCGYSIAELAVNGADPLDDHPPRSQNREYFARVRAFSSATVALGLMRLIRPSGLRSAPRFIKSMTCSGVRDGSRAMSLAARFTAFGDDIDVPESFSFVPPGTKLSTWNPSAWSATVFP